jgi:prepilin-type N-terminal cleavage/methylation domain-containing protein
MKPSLEKYRKGTFKLRLLRAFLSGGAENSGAQAGFSLIEVTIAMVIFLIAILGVFFSFTYAVNYNAGNNSRAQALAILQQKVEQLRSAKFTQTTSDSAVAGGKHAVEPYTTTDGNKFLIQVVVDDNPVTADVDTDVNTKYKEIVVTVSLARPTPGWQTSVPATVVLRRVRGN